VDLKAKHSFWIHIFDDFVGLCVARLNGEVSKPVWIARPVSVERLLWFYEHSEWSDFRHEIREELLTDGGRSPRLSAAREDIVVVARWSDDEKKVTPVARGKGSLTGDRGRVLFPTDYTGFGDAFVEALGLLRKSKHADTWEWLEYVPGNPDDGRIVEFPVAIIREPAAVFPVRGEFGVKSAWFAVRSSGAAAVALSMLGDVPAKKSHNEALTEVQQGGSFEEIPVMFVEPVDGWVLVPFGMLGVEVLNFGEILASLSAAFGEAQLFVSFRGSDAFRWERWRKGKTVRRWSTEGIDLGKVTAAERRIFGDEFEPDEDLLLELAAAWSVNPMELDGPDGEIYAGVLRA
jgi:hypothetical protein